MTRPPSRHPSGHSGRRRPPRPRRPAAVSPRGRRRWAKTSGTGWPGNCTTGPSRRSWRPDWPSTCAWPTCPPDHPTHARLEYAKRLTATAVRRLRSSLQNLREDATAPDEELPDMLGASKPSIPRARST